MVRSLALHSAKQIIAVMCFIYFPSHPNLADLVFYLTGSMSQFMTEVHYEVVEYKDYIQPV